MKIWLILAVLAGGFSGPAVAAQEAEEWSVGQTDDGCFAQKTFYVAGRITTLGIGSSTAGQSILIMQNDGWSTEAGKRYDAYLLADDDFFTGAAIGRENHTLVFRIQPKVGTAIAKAKHLTAWLKIDDNSERMLEQFELTGSGSAISEVRECVRELSEEKDYARRRAEKIPADPFKP